MADGAETAVQELRKLRVAVVHHWLVSWRGGERLLDQILKTIPQAQLFTPLYNRQVVPDNWKERSVVTSFLQHFPGSLHHHEKYLPLLPRALRSFDLRGYDLVLSIESGPAKGVNVPDGAVHLCYVNTPMRYVWEQRQLYLQRVSPLLRPAARVMLNRLRKWDIETVQHVDGLLCNSVNVAKRCERIWGRSGPVVYPPVNSGFFTPGEGGRGGYYLCFGAPVPYKRLDIAVSSCSRLGLPLKVAGGDVSRSIRKHAASCVQFLGRVSDQEARRLYRGCRALLFPGEEDFGIVPLEAQACGRPVIAYRGGGALETVLEGKTGLFFAEQSVDALCGALDSFEKMQGEELRLFPETQCRRNALRFSEEAFHSLFARQVYRMYRESVI